MRKFPPAYWLILLLGLLHLVMAAFVGLAGDEAYYWQWARHLDLGYYDHPPMVAWWIAAGDWLVGTSPLGVRLLMVLLSSVTLLLVYCITVLSVRALQLADVRAETAGLWAVVALAVTPIFSMGGFLATPDIPLIFFWVLAVVLALETVRAPHAGRWLLLGAVLGLGMLAKYTFGLLPLALLISVVASARGRELLRTPDPYLAVFAALVTLLPHWFWLAQHDFVPLLFQLGHGLGVGETERGLGQRLAGLVHFVVGQLGVLTPLLFVIFMAALVYALRRWLQACRSAAAEPGVTLMLWVLVFPAVLTLALFAVASLFAKSQTNWPVAAWLTLAVFAGVVLARWLAGSRVQRGLAIAAILLAALVSGYAHLETLHPLVPYARSVFDKLPEKRGLGAWLQAQRELSPERRNAVVLADNYRTASLLGFYLPDHPPVDSPFETGSGSQFNAWRVAPHTGKAWYLTRHAQDARLQQLYVNYEPAGMFAEQRAGVTISQTWVYFGELR